MKLIIDRINLLAITVFLLTQGEDRIIVTLLAAIVPIK
jgi:hypothetical protein